VEYQETEKRIVRDGGGTIEVNSLAEYVQTVANLILGEKKFSWFRGHGDADWPLVPSIQRSLKKFENPARFYECERYSTNDFQSRASSFLKEKPAMDDFSAWLTIMQHYGLHTRLLDWSRSPLYALYFATQDYKKHGDKDACVWLLSPWELNKHAHLEEKTYIYHMYHRTVEDVVYTAFRVYHRPSDLCVLPEEQRRYERYERSNDTIVACYATETDGRVYNQQSTFTVHSSLRRLTEVHEEIKQNSNEELLIQIIIPANKKEKIFEELFCCGITHSNVFPDLEHVAMDIRKIYPWA